MDQEQRTKYTQVAAKAVSLAELFEARFEQGLDGPVKFRVILAAPDGPSTAGGKQALQHIRLVPADGSGSAIVIGSADTVKHTAEIRTFEHVAELYGQRFRGARVPLDVPKYRHLTQALAVFFRAMKMTVTFADLDGAGPLPGAALGTGDGERGSAVAIVVGVLVALAVIATAYWAIFVHR